MELIINFQSIDFPKIKEVLRDYGVSYKEVKKVKKKKR